MAAPITPIRFLTASQIKRLHARHIKPILPSQPALLESAAGSPVTHENYGQKDVFQLAGILAEKIIRNHSYQDGNKRTGLYAADMFLKENGYQLQVEPSSAAFADAYIRTAANQWTAEDLGNYFKSIAKTDEKL